MTPGPASNFPPPSSRAGGSVGVTPAGLRTLSLAGTEVTLAGVNALKKALPDCAITR